MKYELDMPKKADYGWYVGLEGTSYYLRKDGTVQELMGYKTSNSGWFDTEEEAMKARSKYLKGNEMRKEDLKTGMVIVNEYGEKSTVLLGTENGDIVAGESWHPLDSMFEKDGSIIFSYCTKIQQPCLNSEYGNRSGRVIWENKEPKPEELTLEQICKELGRDVKIVK